MRYFSFLLLLLSFQSLLYAQTRIISSLKESIHSATNDQEKLQAILALCELGYSLHPDTLVAYAARAKALAIQQKNKPKEILALYFFSYALTNKGLIDSSLHVAGICLQQVENNNIHDLALTANIYNQMGRCYMRKNMYKEAINMGNLVITNAEGAGDVLLQVKGKTLIGWAHLEMGQSNEALKWHMLALRSTDDESLLDRYAIIYANIALNYRGLGKTDSSFYYIEKAVGASRKYENLFALSNSLAIKAQLLVNNGKSLQAEETLKEVVEIRKLIGDPFYITSDMAQLALYYANNGQPAKGIALCMEGIALAEKYKLDTKLFFLYTALGENYKVSRDYVKYSGVLEKIIQLKDSIYETNSAQAIAELQTKYDLQKKENIIIQNELEIINKSYLLYGSLLLSAIGVALLLVLFRHYRSRQKIKMIKMMEDEKKLAIEAIHRAEENERKRIAADLHDNMGAYASAISANVDELLSLPDDSTSVLQDMKTNASEIMLNLRDTIWVLNREEILLTGVSDRFKSYVHKISKAYGGISTEFVEKINKNISLSPEKALNMLRIMQEAFHNAIKHSQCTNITVEIVSNDKWCIRIMDNGIGLHMLNNKSGGDGLKNMQHRARSNQWNFKMKNIGPGGTLMELSA